MSRVWLSAFFFVGLAALFVERMALRALVRRWARVVGLERRTFIVGAADNGEHLVRSL